jgi:hypothetical protein
MTITLANLAQASEVEVFEHVAKHLLNQGMRCMNGTRCGYRSETPGDGMACAAGCLIADDEYRPGFESEMWGSLVNKHLVPAAHCGLISDLQMIHDRGDPDNWEAKLRTLAADVGSKMFD